MFLFSGNALEYLGVEQYQETTHTHTHTKHTHVGKKEMGQGEREKRQM